MEGLTLSLGQPEKFTVGAMPASVLAGLSLGSASPVSMAFHPEVDPANPKTQDLGRLWEREGLEVSPWSTPVFRRLPV